jgi:hypothetical protein
VRIIVRGRHTGVARIGLALAFAGATPIVRAQVPTDSSSVAKPGMAAPSMLRRGMSTVSGRVEDENGSPVSHAAVTMVGSGDSALTDENGRFVLHVASGAYILAIRRLGLRAERFAVSLASGEERDVTIVESRTVPVLPTVTTTAQERAAYRGVGFEQRMKIGIGQFLTFEQIQQRHATRLSQLLDQMRGIQVHIKDPKSFDYSVEGTRGPASCVGYVVDGVPQVQLPPTVAHPADGADDFMDPSLVGAIEVYSSSERPAEFGPGLNERAPPIPFAAPPKIDVGAQQCSLVVIWTRARLGLTGEQPAGRTSNAGNGGALEQTAVTPDITLGEAVFANDASCHAPAAADTVDLAVYATIEGPPPAPISDTAWAAYKGRVLAALDRSAVLPSVFVLPAFGLPLSGTATDSRGTAPGMTVAPTLSNVIAFTLDDSGALTDAHVAASSLSGSADTTALAMVERAGAAHAFPHAPSTSDGKGATHLLLVTASIEPRVDVRAAVLGELEVPSWRLTRPARLAARSDQSDSAIRHVVDRGDTVTLEAVIDEEGRVVPSTVRLIGTTAGVGSVALTDRVSRLRFEPALIGRCPVPELVLQRVTLGTPTRPGDL